ncbi:Vacuolar protein-sorting-associated protein 24 [Malassezia pachydermatis]|uniref:Vacuolar sorting protein vps24 n=1 Tax=Malassezia pachydermatis TaxID=77020 RepID=A0A0M9VPW8_9BASI|nr:vacuolar sorting protein vps24 [Malassezia pachydermatis]KOS14873.1 vacuolar sorting protein vps24 [Malassezia pachydermatis]
MQSIKRLVYGPTKEERVREVQRRLRQEQRGLDREIRQIDQAIVKVKGDIKRLARKGDVKNATVLAKEVVRSKKHRTRLITSKAQLNSISLQLQQQLSMLKVTGHLQKSTEIMKLSNNLIKIPQMSQSMREMSAELMKAGILEEMMQDTLDASILGEDQDEIEEAAQGEVEQVLYELTDGQLGEATSASALPQLDTGATSHADAENIEEMQAALQGLLQGQ